MGIIAWLNETRATVVSPLHPRDPALARIFGLSSIASAGVAVTPVTAMRQSAVYASVRLLAETVAQLPLIIYRRRTDGGRERDPSHPLHRILHDRPNENQTSFEFREMLEGHAALRGNGYAFIDQTAGGQVRSLIPLHPDHTRPFKAPDGLVAYDHQPPNGPRGVLLNHEVLHIPALSFDGIQGHSPIEVQRDTIGWAIATKEHGAKLFANAAQPKGGLRIPGVLGDPAADALRESWERRHKGVENHHKIALLEGGMEWVELGMSNEDAQFIQSMEFQVADVARIFRVPPHMIADLKRSTFNNIEQQSLEFVKYTMTPWLRRWENRLNEWLLSETDRRTHFIEFNVDGLLRGDFKSRQEGYRIGRMGGWLSANDIRKLENADPLPPEVGDIYWMPLNMAPADEIMSVLNSKRGGTAPSNANGDARKHKIDKENRGDERH